jgi:two-component system response regulator NreC
VTTVLIISNEPIPRVGLRHLLASEPGFKVLGETEEKDAVQRASELKPDVILFHVPEVRPSFAEAISNMQRARKIGIVVLCREIEHSHLGRILAAGVAAVVLLRGTPQYLFGGLRAAARGRRFVDPNLSDQILDALAAETFNATKPLSRRELQVLRMFAQGYTLKEIASELGVSPKSVETYQARLREKLNLRTRADLVSYALETGILKGTSTSGQGV